MLEYLERKIVDSTEFFFPLEIFLPQRVEVKSPSKILKSSLESKKKIKIGIL